MRGREPVILVDLGGERKVYPLQILMWHEIANDRVGGVPVAVVAASGSAATRSEPCRARPTFTARLALVTAFAPVAIRTDGASRTD